MTPVFKVLPPAEAVKYFEQKGMHIGFDWRDTENKAHAVSFTAAKITQIDVLQDIRDAIEKAKKNGTTLEQFKKDLIPTLAKKGWWGEKEVIDELTGEVKTIKINPARLKTIFETNLRVSYMEGQWARIQDHKKTFPYLRYDGCNSKESRPTHCGWNGLVLAADDPWWLAHYPVKEWGCKCNVKSLTKSQAEKVGVDQAPEETYTNWTNPRTGQTQRVPEGVHPAFNYPPGQWQQHLEKTAQERLSALPANLRETISTPEVSNIGGASPAFEESLNKTLQNLPNVALGALARTGYEIQTGKFLPDILPHLKESIPQGYESGYSWYNTDGMASTSGKVIAIAETMKAFPSGKSLITSPERARGLLLHEIAHAYDLTMDISGNPDILSAYERDKKTLIGLKVSQDIQFELNYMQQANKKGIREVVAELFAQHFNGKTAQSLVATFFPQTAQVLFKHLQNLMEKL